MQGITASNTSLSGQSARISIDKSPNETVFGLRVHFRVSLAKDMKRKATIAILDASCLGRRLENRANHYSPLLYVSFRRDCLVEDTRLDVVFLGQRCRGEKEFRSRVLRTYTSLNFQRTIVIVVTPISGLVRKHCKHEFQ